MKRAVGFAVAMILGAAIARGAGPGGPVALDGIVKDLSSEDFAVRQAAAKRLDEVPAAQRDELEKLAAKSTDTETRAHLLGRVAAIDEILLLNPPPISLDIKDASYADTAAAMTKAIGKLITAQNGGGDVKFTLKATDEPFWEVYRQLSEQHPFRHGPSPTGIWMLPMNGPMMDGTFVLPAAQVSGPLIVYVTRETVAAGAGGAELRINLTAFADPRMQTTLARLTITEAFDGKGNALELLPVASFGGGGSGPVGPDDYKRVNRILSGAVLRPPADAKGTVTLKGTAILHVVTQYATRTIEEAEKHVGETFELGGRKVTLDVVDVPKEGVNGRFQATVTSDAPAANVLEDPLAKEGAITSVTGELLKITEVDSMGQPLLQIAARGKIIKGIEATAQRVVPPVRVILAAPVKWKLVTVPVVVKDLAWPGK